MNLHPDFKIILFYENIEYIATQSGSLKSVTVEQFLISSSSEFQRTEAANANERRPNVFILNF